MDEIIYIPLLGYRRHHDISFISISLLSHGRQCFLTSKIVRSQSEYFFFVTCLFRFVSVTRELNRVSGSCFCFILVFKYSEPIPYIHLSCSARIFPNVCFSFYIVIVTFFFRHTSHSQLSSVASLHKLSTSNCFSLFLPVGFAQIACITVLAVLGIKRMSASNLGLDEWSAFGYF